MKKPLRNILRLIVSIHGAVQGVGFRPFVYRLATEMSLAGQVSNSNQGVFVEVEGTKDLLDTFILRLQNELPSQAFIQSMEFSFLDPIGFQSFEIRKSDSSGAKTTLVLPDIATCPDCLKEIFDPTSRRYLYPFTNCTNCGPRFTIIEALPYDRPNTSMKNFKMCPQCSNEYENPLDRRFHAQPNACPQCGPQIELWNDEGKKLATHHNALLQTTEAIRDGKIIAIKGLGGFLLMADARNDNVISRLREKKHREEKPFALIFPSIINIEKECNLNDFERRLLSSPESPIVLLKRKLNKTEIQNLKSQITFSIAPNNPYLGVMLPYTPLYHILMKELGFPVVATSGNLSDEPICTDETDALRRLYGIADLFLVHNRPIVRHVDDSIVRVMMGRELVLRRARGYAPLPIYVGTQNIVSILAVGAHLKNTIALTSDQNIFISQHIGDLETQESLNAFNTVIKDFQELYETKPSLIACDLHPDYLSSKFAKNCGVETFSVQHHYAHIASCMAENQLEGKLLGVSWDGTGYGLDGSIWGGEFLLITEKSFDRLATFRSFQLPGGEKAIKEPRRTAIGILYEIFGNEIFRQKDLLPIQSFKPMELNILSNMLENKVNSPITTSAGRLFDAVASLIGIRQISNFEGQAAMELEFLTTSINPDEAGKIGNYRFEIKDKKLEVENGYKTPITNHQSTVYIDWSQIIISIIEDVQNETMSSTIAIKFHNTLSEIIITVAKHIGQERVVLSGGCFQNMYLTEQTIKRLKDEGFRPYWHQRVPPNDGGVALGQVYAAIRNNYKNIS